MRTDTEKVDVNWTTPGPAPALRTVGFACRRRHRCKYGAGRLTNGIGWGRLPEPKEPWRFWHERICGGELVEVHAPLDVELEVVERERVAALLPSNGQGTADERG